MCAAVLTSRHYCCGRVTAHRCHSATTCATRLRTTASTGSRQQWLDLVSAAPARVARRALQTNAPGVGVASSTPRPTRALHARSALQTTRLAYWRLPWRGDAAWRVDSVSAVVSAVVSVVSCDAIVSTRRANPPCTPSHHMGAPTTTLPHGARTTWWRKLLYYRTVHTPHGGTSSTARAAKPDSIPTRAVSL